MTTLTSGRPGSAEARQPGQPAASPRDRGVFPSLDGLRIVAVTAVVATHVAFWTGHYSHGSARALLSHLDVGVAVFFVISGFLISREWLVRDRTTGGLPHLGDYARRRGLRILPMYWLTVVIAFVAIAANHRLGVVDWVRQLLLVQIYGGDHLVGGLTQTWSLATEAAFYAVLPAIAWAVVRVARTRARVPLVAGVAAVVLTVASLVWVAYYHAAGPGWAATAGYWLPTSLSWFMAGTWLAAVRIGADDPDSRGVRRWRALDVVGDSPGVCVLVALCAFAIAATPLSADPSDPFATAGQAVTQRVLYLVVALGLVAPAVLGRGEVYDRVLGHPVLRYLGRISYSIFLLHLMLLQGITALLGQPVFTGSTLPTFVLTWAISIPLAALAYHLVERPLQIRGRRLPRTPAPREVEPAPTP